MFASKFAVGSFRSSRSSAWRAFSNTAATFADQYDVVIVGMFAFVVLMLCFKLCILSLISFYFFQAVDLEDTSLPSNPPKWA